MLPPVKFPPCPPGPLSLPPSYHVRFEPSPAISLVFWPLMESSFPLGVVPYMYGDAL
jgi:hypothetical protein